MADIAELVKIEITKPLPATGVAGTTYKIEGSVKMFDAIGAPPWVYAEVRRKEWWKPEIIEEVSYERGFPIPVTGTFSIDIKPEKKSDYEVTVIATPAPLSLPVVGVFPITGKSDTVKMRVAEPVATDIKNIEISVIGPVIPATDFKNIAISVLGPAFPATDFKNIEIDVIGPEFPATDFKNIEIDVIGPEFPATDLKNIEIALIAVPVEYKGTISKKELEYNESQRTIPAYNIPQDERGLVHVWGRNDMAISQKLGIRWVVKGPDGIVVEDYQDWEFGTTGPGDDHHFIGGRFDLNKPGTWTIGISLAMNPDSPLTVDSYPGVLCTVAVAPPEEYTLEVTIEPPGAGLVIYSPKKATYSPGEVVTLVATPNPGYQFDHWGGWPSYPGIGSTSDTLNLTMDNNWWVVAAFREVAPPPEEYTLEVTIEPPATGYVTKSPSKAKYSAGEVVTLTAHPYSGYEFDHWGGHPPYPGIQSTSPTLELTMTADWWVVAAFRKVAVTQCPLSVSASPSYGGSVTRSPDKSLYDDGEMITVTATARSGWSFDKFTGRRPDGSTWTSSANPVYPRGCRTTSVTAHFIEEAPPKEELCYHHYRVTYLDGSSEIISWQSDPITKPSLWDFVDRDKLLSWEYLGCY